MEKNSKEITKQLTKQPEGLTTAVFIDYDSWFWSVYKYGERPDYIWLNELLANHDVVSVTAFGVFRNRPEMEGERSRLASLTPDVVDCTDLYKEATDYAILDAIYRKVITVPDIQQYVIVTGDSHYSQTISFLRNGMGKTVGAIGISGSMGKRLKDSVDWYIEQQSQVNVESYISPLLQTIRWAEAHGLIATFDRTVKNTAAYHGFHKGVLETALRQLIESGLIEQHAARTQNGGLVNGMFPRWDKLSMYELPKAS